MYFDLTCRNVLLRAIKLLFLVILKLAFDLFWLTNLSQRLTLKLPQPKAELLMLELLFMLNRNTCMLFFGLHLIITAYLFEPTLQQSKHGR